MSHAFHRPDSAAVHAMLAANALPTSDLPNLDMDLFLGIGQTDQPDGVIGLQVIGCDGLLRSLVVAERVRGQGSGQALVGGLEDLAVMRGVQTLYLLTNTAEDFFRKLGYVKIDRKFASEGIRQTQEFSSLCPEDAAVMRKVLPSQSPC